MISNFEPKDVFSYFEKICSIPHGSYHTDLIADYIVSFAKEHNLEYSRDLSNNIVIKKPASADCKSNSTVIIQGHTDMVCAKDDDCKINFETDGLTLEYDEKYIYAKGTTLGGDDGIAVAMALAILASNSITHPALECVFTTEEEVGMLGATAMDMSKLKGKYLLNIDSEDEGQFTVSCAGGETLVATMPMLSISKMLQNGAKISVSGLIGGHSGVEINKGRANANIVMGKILGELSKVADVQLASIFGGQKDNAIPLDCVAIINVDDFNAVDDCIKRITPEIEKQYPVEKNMAIKAEKIEASQGFDCNAIDVLSSVTNGVRKMSEDIDGLVQTSSNLGVVKTENNNVVMTFSLRSAVGAEKAELHGEIEGLVAKNGGSVESFGEYPAWEYKKDSKLRSACVETYVDQYGEEPQIVAIHAGLECGIFSSKIEGLDCVSYGPNLLDIHTTNERMEIKSVERVYEFTKSLLKKL